MNQVNRRYVAIFSRYGVIHAWGFGTLGEAKGFIRRNEDLGEISLDCITDENFKIIHDLVAENIGKTYNTAAIKDENIDLYYE